MQHLDTIPQSGVRRRRIWDDPTIPRDDVRLINSHYDDLYRVPNHGVVQVDRSDGSSYTARVEHLDDYHFDMGEFGNVYHGGQLDEPELTIQEVREEILEAHHMEKGRRVLKDYDLIMDKAAEAEELGLSNHPSTLEKLAELASGKSAPKPSVHSEPEL